MNQRPPNRSSRLRWFLSRGVVVLVATSLLLALGSSGCMEKLFYYPTRGETIPPPHLADAQSVWFPSADGTRLHGWLIAAADGTPPQHAATILHVHGNAGNIESHVWFTEHLPPAGFNLFIFDYRGYGRSEGSARRRGPLIEDANAAVDALLSRPDVDPSRLGMYAQSLGGAIGLNVMADRPQVRAAVIESAFTSWREMAASAVGGDPPGRVSRFMAGLLIGDDHRPADAVARIDRPILLLHGTADSIVPVGHGRRLAAAGRTVQLVELDGGDHNSLRATHPEVDRLMIEFFRRELAPQ